MLRSLHIENYALINELHMQLHSGFSVITGETGAGKSILLGALGLLLGQRAEARSIRTGANRCIIEAEFDLSGYDIADFFEQNDLDFDDSTCIVRRELTSTGKSRAFINDTPAQLTQLRELGDRLIDIHSQHQNLLLAKENFQMNVLDILAHDKAEREDYSKLYAAHHDAVHRLQEAQEALSRGRDDEDYLRYQLQQLDELELVEGQQEEYEQEQTLLQHAEEIERALYAADSLLSGDGQQSEGALSALREAGREIEDIAAMLPVADELASRIESCRIELKDIADELENQASRITINPERLANINQWLSQLYSLQQKHHVQTEAELIALAEDFRKQLEAIDNSDENIKALEAEVKATHNAATEAAKRLTAKRTEAAHEVERQMESRLVPLGIPNIKFHVEIKATADLQPSGKDEICFLFSANKNNPLQPISEVASGGETARVMLSLKAMISGAVSLPTIIFDEIDTGVSGQTAEKMARIMREMGDGGRQVISITHLPQIAALAEHHYRVYKKDDETSTTSNIEELSESERITELAHMLSGAQITDAAIENAKELLKQ